MVPVYSYYFFPYCHTECIAYLLDTYPLPIRLPPRNQRFLPTACIFRIRGRRGNGGIMSRKGLWKVEAMVIVEVLLDHGLLDLAVYLIDDGHEIVLKLDLQLLVVAAALVGSAPLEDLRKTEEDLAPAARSLGGEFDAIIDYELQVNLVFLVAPLAYLALSLVEVVRRHPAGQVLRLETLLSLFQRVRVLLPPPFATLAQRDNALFASYVQLQHSTVIAQLGKLLQHQLNKTTYHTLHRSSIAKLAPPSMLQPWFSFLVCLPPRPSFILNDCFSVKKSPLSDRKNAFIGWRKKNGSRDRAAFLIKFKDR